MVSILISVYGAYGLVVRAGSVPFPAEIGSLGEWLWVPAVGLLGIYSVLLFPDGRLPLERWRYLVWLSEAVILLASAGTALSPGPLPDLGGLHNPFGLAEHPWVAKALSSVLPLLPLCILASAISLALRSPRSRGEEREQTKWIAFAALAVAFGYLALWAGEALFEPGPPGSSGRFWASSRRMP
jgi:hypothetical protein